MPNDFFNKQEDQVLENMDNQDIQVEEQPQIIKIGEKEYSQADVERLVGLGEIGAEAEEKYGVKIDKIWPNHQRTINEKLALEQELNSYKNRPVVQTQEQLTQQQIDEQLRQELAKHGYRTESEMREMVRNELAGQKLIQDTQSTIDSMAEIGYPTTSVDELFRFMADPANPKDPKQAYKLMFEDEIDRIKESKIRSLKDSGFVTQSQSTAGSKSPAPQKITNKNLRDSLMDALQD